jgi:hypothetical protein
VSFPLTYHSQCEQRHSSRHDWQLELGGRGASREQAGDSALRSGACSRESSSVWVFRIESRDGKSYAVAQPIQIGNTYGNAIEVTSGVLKQERIVALGGELLQNEQEIRVLQ